MSFEAIVNKHNYSKEFAVFLEKVCEELVNYFNDEDLVYEAILNTPIVFVGNCYNYAKENGFLNSPDNGVEAVSQASLNRSAGVYLSEPIITFNNGLYYISEIKRAVLVTNFTADYSKGTLIHELCHLIKGYYNEYRIDGNILYSYGGLIESQYALSYDGQNVTKTLFKETGVGLEEGLNTIVEEIITIKTFNEQYKSSGYGVVKTVAENLLLDAEDNELLKVIINAQLYHNYQEIIDILGEDDYQKLNMVVDEIYRMSLEIYAYAFDEEKMLEASAKLNEYIKSEYIPLRIQIKDHLSQLKR